MAYPVPARRPRWRVQIEFLDGTTIDGMSDDDVLDRWRRLASWSDPLIAKNRDDWLWRVLDRARRDYGAALIGLHPRSDPRLLLDGLAAERCLTLRRR